MNTAYKWLLLILLFAAPAFAQNVRYDNVAFSSVQGFPFLPSATITVCTAVGAGQPCSPTVAGLCATISDTVCNQPATFTSDTLGNFGFWIQPGTYTYTVTKAGFGGFGPKPLTFPCQPASTCTITGAQTITGLLSCKSFGNIPCVDPANSQGWTGTDYGAWVNSAIATLPLVIPAPPSNGGVSYPAGTVYLFPPANGGNVTVSTTISINSPLVSLIGPGSAALVLACPSSGDCIRVRTNPFNQAQGVILHGFTLLGNNTATSGLHYGDIMAGRIDDVEITNFTAAGAIGFWEDNVLGFTERSTLDRLSLDNNTINWKKTNNGAACGGFFGSNSYERITNVWMRVAANGTGLEVGPGISWSHLPFVGLNINGVGAGKTFFKMDAASGSCAAAGSNNNGPFAIVAEDDGSGATAGGTFISMAAGTTLGGAPCVLQNFNASPAMTNTLSGTLACATYLGPTGNQPILDSRLFSATQEQATVSSDGAGIDMTIALTRNNLQPISTDLGISIIGNAGDSCSGSAQGDVCIRNYNVGNQTSFAGSGGTVSLAVTNTGFKGAAGSVVTSTGGGGTLAVLGSPQTFTAAQTFGAGSSINFAALLVSPTVPTIAAAGCGGGAAAIVTPNGTAAFKVNVGTTPGSACTFTMPTATTGWNVTCNDITTQSTSVFVQKQTGAESTTSVTITNFSDVAVATAFVASDILKCTAAAD